jgi:hypothetical protein
LSLCASAGPTSATRVTPVTGVNTVLHPTLETGVAAMVVASHAWLAT